VVRFTSQSLYQPCYHWMMGSVGPRADVDGHVTGLSQLMSLRIAENSLIFNRIRDYFLDDILR